MFGSTRLKGSASKDVSDAHARTPMARTHTRHSLDAIVVVVHATSPVQFLGIIREWVCRARADLGRDHASECESIQGGQVLHGEL